MGAATGPQHATVSLTRAAQVCAAAVAILDAGPTIAGTATGRGTIVPSPI